MSTGCRSSGGVVIVDISRMPVIAISRVRGIGVADIAEHVDGGAEPLHLLLVLDAEPLLLVDDDQAEVLDPDVGVEQPVGADDDVDGALAQPVHDVARLRVGLEADSGFEVTGNAAHPLGERREVLVTSSVVGTRTATCLPSCTALNAARTAISVLP